MRSPLLFDPPGAPLNKGEEVVKVSVNNTRTRTTLSSPDYPGDLGGSRLRYKREKHKILVLC